MHPADLSVNFEGFVIELAYGRNPLGHILRDVQILAVTDIEMALIADMTERVEIRIFLGEIVVGEQ